MRRQIRPCVVFFWWPSYGKGFRVRRWYHSLCIRWLDIKAVKKAVGEYERIAGAKVNFDKSEGLRFGAWRGSDALSEPFRWSDGPVRILRAWFGPDLQLERNWLEVQAKVDAQVGTWLSRRLSLKGRAGAYAVYVFPLILYRLAVFPLPKAHRLALQRSSSNYSREAEGRWSVDRSLSNVRATGVWVGLIWRATGLLKDLTGDAVWRRKTSRTFPRLQSSRWAKHRLFASAEWLFVTFLGPITSHGFGKSYIGS